nr:hypothetical protein Iba_chr07bCG5560 [Ipomoea batatas]
MSEAAAAAPWRYPNGAGRLYCSALDGNFWAAHLEARRCRNETPRSGEEEGGGFAVMEPAALQMRMSAGIRDVWQDIALLMLAKSCCDVELAERGFLSDGAAVLRVSSLCMLMAPACEDGGGVGLSLKWRRHPRGRRRISDQAVFALS